MTDNLPKATHSGTLKVGDLSIPCFVLDNGIRVISGRGMTAAIGMKGRGQGMLRIPTHKTLKPFIDKDLDVAIQNPIKFFGFSPKQSTPTPGYEATILLQICEVILTARDHGALKTPQEIRYAQYCDALVRAFAKVGIIALVDEATGYQAERDKNELHRILEAYIATELLPWSKRFPNEFYHELFRLRGWQFRPLSVKRPIIVGKLTNQLVYEKLPPGVLDELKRLNPPNNKGRRKHKHHQFLTDDIGNPHLEKHLAAIIALMRASATWTGFKRLFARSFPDRPDQQLELFDFEDDE